MKNNKELVTAIHKSKFLKLDYDWSGKLLKIGQSYSTANNVLYQLFPIRDNSLFWSYGSILSKIGTALIDVLSLVPGAIFGR